jgi:hypothetical protein
MLPAILMKVLKKFWLKADGVNSANTDARRGVPTDVQADEHGTENDTHGADPELDSLTSSRASADSAASSLSSPGRSCSVSPTLGARMHSTSPMCLFPAPRVVSLAHHVYT